MALLEPTQHRRFTVEEVERMLEAGILGEDEPVELLEGELVVMPPQKPEHADTTEVAARLLEAAYGPGVHARRHSPLVAGSDSLPEPDVALVRRPAGSYRGRHPTGEDALLVVEVARTSASYDRRKAAIYSRAGVPMYWLLDLGRGRLEVHSDPRPGGEYRLIRVLERGERVAVPGSDAEIAVSDLLP